MFRASTIYQDVSIIDDLNCFKIPYTDEVLTIDGWKKVKDLSLQDSLVNDDEIGHIKDIYCPFCVSINKMKLESYSQ